ncbi:FAD-binding oxidoreductase [Flavobacterium aquiphilum]|uniref:FAD-binding oxidoreductase n=1 Tax=Flavobacterium aquiphilum TaxID=3003261 RepID=UPI0024808DCB|nr:FAD-binding oxidoreductase [Flavobacterium aquiphilum]
METHVVKILKAFYINHDVKCFVTEKPSGYDFIPGQATDVSINLPEWEDKLRPFTFTNLKEQNYLEFMIKIYKDHEGVTNKLGSINAGSELILHDVFGAIQYKEKGTFIAGGAGITPFISIFRDLYKKQEIHGNKLIFSNKTAEDVIMPEELQKMLKKDFLNVFTRENVIGFQEKRIDRNFLIDTIADFSQNFYVCGPSDFVKNITNHLFDLGANVDTVVFEK